MKREDFIAIALLAFGVVLALVYSWWRDSRRKSGRHLESGGADKQRMPSDSLHNDIPWELIVAVVVVLGIALGIHITFGWNVIASIATPVAVAAVLVVGWVWLWGSRRMRYSPEGARALTRIVEELRAQVLTGHHGVSAQVCHDRKYL